MRGRGRFLDQGADVGQDAARVPGDRLAEHGDRAARGVHEAEEHADEGGFATAVRAEEPVPVAVPDVQADFAYGLDVAEPLCQLLRGDHGPSASSCATRVRT